MSKKKKLSELLLEERESLGLTQVKFANKIGINSNTLARIERGEQKPSINTIRLIVKASKANADTILEAWDEEFGD
jgi:transcriptional regulator with XRE-family HTH domain